MIGSLILVPADIGNINTKYRRQGGVWEIEPSLVRLYSRDTGYSFTHDVPVRPLVYLSGPAGIEPNVPYLVGHDAQRAGAADVAVISSAELRVYSPAYLLLHLYAIIASLPPGVTSAHIAFAGGLPVEDDVNPRVKELLRKRLTGKSDASSAAISHTLRWGETTYTITVEKTSFIPQPIGAIATLLFTPDGRITMNSGMLRQRYALDIGGGTTDFTGRKGLELIPAPKAAFVSGCRTRPKQRGRSSRGAIQLCGTSMPRRW